jgi:glycine/D-amino acid oxidase-like deaminating enzyme
MGTWPVLPDPPPESWRDASLWARQASGSFGSLTEDRSVDVVVVGAGIAGLLTATLLHESGAAVIVVDRHDVGGIATRNTTAKVTALQGTRYHDITSARDADAAAEYAAAQLDAVAGLRQLIHARGIECAMTDAPAYTYATLPDTGERVATEFDAARAAGLPVEWTTDTGLPFPVTGAVRLDQQFHIDPGALCVQLAAALGPTRVFTESAVKDVDEDEHGCTVTFEQGRTVSASHVVIATQGPVVDPALLANRCTPMQSYALAARLQRAVPTGMYLSCDPDPRSLRPAVVDGDLFAIVGGAGHHMGDDAAAPERWEVLAAWTEEHFGTSVVTHRWATHDLTTSDHVPFIGNLGPRARRRWVASGFAKWGMTNGYVAARIISERIGGSSVAWAATFDSTRVASTLTRDLLSIGVTSTRALVVDRITRRNAPRCTHQGCVLREDRALGTWDCPCHGSRFDGAGNVIQGPANRSLA